MTTLDEACLGAAPSSFEEEMRSRAAEVYRGLYGEPMGTLMHVPAYAQYKVGDRLVAKTTDGKERKCVVLRAAPDLGLIEVVYGNAQ